LGESAVLSAREELWLNAEVVRSDISEFEGALDPILFI
jgi:hypothetical protein